MQAAPKVAARQPSEQPGRNSVLSMMSSAYQPDGTTASSHAFTGESEQEDKSEVEIAIEQEEILRYGPLSLDSNHGTLLPL